MRGIMREYLLRWTLNGMPQAPFLCSEGEGEALLLGHLVASGMVDEAGDIQSIWYDNGLWTVQALLKEGAAIPALMRLDGLKPLESALSLPASEIIACCEQVMGLDHAAGLHAILLSDGEKTSLGRDIGRHNAVEKAVGKSDAADSSLDLLSLEMFENIAYIMAKHADPSIPDTPEDWLDRFNTFSIYQVLPQLIELWGLNVQTAVQSKKNFAQLSGK